MAALMAGGMTGVKAEVPFPAVASNARLWFRHDSGADVAVMLPSEDRKKNMEIHMETLHLLLWGLSA